MLFFRSLLYFARFVLNSIARLIDLIKATKNQVVNIAVSIAPQSFQDTNNKNKIQAGVAPSAGSGGLRRSLSGDFNENGAMCSPAKKIKIEFHPQHQQQQNGDQNTMQNLPVLKSLVSIVESPKSSQQQQQQQQQHPRIQVVTSETQANLFNSIKAAAAAAAGQQQQKINGDANGARQAYRPLLISNTLPLASKTNGNANVFQIIPIQCKPLKTVHDKPIHAVPLVLGQQPNNVGAVSSNNNQQANNNNVLTMLMRQPLVAVNSPNVLLSPRNQQQMMKKSAPSPIAEMLTTQQIAEKYPEYFTPPNHMHQNIGGGVVTAGNKPAANPIIFPKMTPETPSSEPKNALNAVTRKLMSFQNETGVEQPQHG